MLWEVEIESKSSDLERARVAEEYALLTGGHAGENQSAALLARTTRGYLLEGLDEPNAQRLVQEMPPDPLVETSRLAEVGGLTDKARLTVLPKPGVMDPVAQSILDAA